MGEVGEGTILEPSSAEFEVRALIDYIQNGVCPCRVCSESSFCTFLLWFGSQLWPFRSGNQGETGFKSSIACREARSCALGGGEVCLRGVDGG